MPKHPLEKSNYLTRRDFLKIACFAALSLFGLSKYFPVSAAPLEKSSLTNEQLNNQINLVDQTTRNIIEANNIKPKDISFYPDGQIKPPELPNNWKEATPGHINPDQMRDWNLQINDRPDGFELPTSKQFVGEVLNEISDPRQSTFYKELADFFAVNLRFTDGSLQSLVISPDGNNYWEDLPIQYVYGGDKGNNTLGELERWTDQNERSHQRIVLKIDSTSLKEPFDQWWFEKKQVLIHELYHLADYMKAVKEKQLTGKAAINEFGNRHTLDIEMPAYWAEAKYSNLMIAANSRLTDYNDDMNKLAKIMSTTGFEFLNNQSGGNFNLLTPEQQQILSDYQSPELFNLRLSSLWLQRIAYHLFTDGSTLKIKDATDFAKENPYFDESIKTLYELHAFSGLRYAVYLSKMGRIPEAAVVFHDLFKTNCNMLILLAGAMVLLLYLRNRVNKKYHNLMDNSVN